MYRPHWAPTCRSDIARQCQMTVLSVGYQLVADGQFDRITDLLSGNTGR